jgi:segregation and condensation protein A
MPTRDTEYRIHLPQAGFEGPLDLLLHLIQEHELDILDIPMGFVTERFLAYLRLMGLLSIDIASEYLVMAATLAHIKSKMLLPVVPYGQDDDGLPADEEDPRAELVLRLLEYQKYKTAAAELANRGTLGCDVFGRGVREPVPEGPGPLAPASVFSLLDALENVLKRSSVRLDHEVVFDRISITDRIVELTERLAGRPRMRFDEMLLEPGAPPPTRFDIVITFLSILEMVRLRVVRVYQSEPLAPIHIELATLASSGAGGQPPEDAPNATVMSRHDDEPNAAETRTPTEPETRGKLTEAE